MSIYSPVMLLRYRQVALSDTLIEIFDVTELLHREEKLQKG